MNKWISMLIVICCLIGLTTVAAGQESYLLAVRPDNVEQIGQYMVTSDQLPSFFALGTGRDPEIPVGTHVTISVQDGGEFSLDISGKDGIGSDTGSFDVPGTYSFQANSEGKVRIIFGRVGIGFYQAEFVVVPPGVSTDIYANLQTEEGYWRPIYQPGFSAEEGDQITLSGSERYIDSIDVAIFSSFSSVSGTTYVGNIEATVRLYANDGPEGEPGTLLWDSGDEYIPYGETLNTYSFAVPSILVPDTFTWTIEILNVYPANEDGLYNLGLPLYDPPVVGSSGNFGWQNHPWHQVSSSSGPEIFNYGARVQASAASTQLPNSYFITASVVSGSGTISPVDTVTVNKGDSQTFTIAPDEGWQVHSVVVDGADKGAVTTYTFTNVTANHTIKAYFKMITHTITASAGTGGSITPSGTVSVVSGADQTYTITPDPGYHRDSFTVDGFVPIVTDPVRVVAEEPTTYTLTDIHEDHTIVATFAANKPCTITVTASSGGDISPGTTSLLIGQSQTFTITSNEGYRVADVLVDGASVGKVPVYNFTNVQGSHTISASFEPDVYTITAMAYAGGSISPSGATVVNREGSQTYTITPDEGYEVRYVVVDGVSKGAVTTYTITNVTANHTIAAYFISTKYTITASAGPGGSISPSGSVSVSSGAIQTFTITPAVGFHVSDVVVDGVSKGAITIFTFTNVTAAHSISATFAQGAIYTITATAGENGSISPTGAVPVASGANQTFTFTPATGNRVLAVTVDGVSRGTSSLYRFTNVTADHTINVTFTPDVFTITAMAYAGGSISPDGDTAVNRGGSQIFTITPDPGYEVRYVVVDGVSKGAVTTYTITNVTANHTIKAYFKVTP